jgi:hypothetical protein
MEVIAGPEHNEMGYIERGSFAKKHGVLQEKLLWI